MISGCAHQKRQKSKVFFLRAKSEIEFCTVDKAMQRIGKMGRGI